MPNDKVNNYGKMRFLRIYSVVLSVTAITLVLVAALSQSKLDPANDPLHSVEVVTTEASDISSLRSELTKANEEIAALKSQIEELRSVIEK